MNIDLLKQCVAEFYGNLPLFEKIHSYYKGDTDAMATYKMVTERSNLKAYCNYIKKFVKEETSYILGNPITYISKTGNKEILQAIDANTAHWLESHDEKLGRKMIQYGYCYELYYLDENARFSATVTSPRSSYALANEKGKVELFLRFFTKKFDDKQYLDVYLTDRIEHYSVTNDGKDYEVIKESEPTAHIFGEVPVSLCQLSDEQENDTLYKDLKGLQDAYETNLSDATNEISDFRAAYLKLIGATADKETLDEMKEKGAIEVPASGNVEWLIKNINDSFIQNTLNNLESKIYQISSHINYNEKLQSNTSSLALRARLISLENKCTSNMKAVADCLKSRMRFLFKFLAIKTNKELDYTDIQYKFTPMIPADDLVMAQIINQMGDKLSTKTGLAQLSFVNNPDVEMERIKKEQDEQIDLDKVDGEDE